MIADDCKKVSEENIRRADAAEAVQLSMQVCLTHINQWLCNSLKLQNEVIEARAIQQFNAQLHKFDLLFYCRMIDLRACT
jgi:hypothetical protein